MALLHWMGISRLNMLEETLNGPKSNMRWHCLGASQIISFESSMKGVQVHWKSHRFQWTRRGSCNASSGDLKRRGRLICCGKLKLWALCILGARRIARETPRCGRTPHSGPRAHMALWCTPADREPGWLCAHYASRGESEWVSGSGREAEGWLPRPAGSPGPNTALMRATGTDGHTQGARDYCAGPRGAGERDPRRGGEESPIGSPAADLCPCSHSVSMHWCFLLMMVHVWNICTNLPVGTCVPHVLYTLHVCMMLVYAIPMKILSSEARSIKQLS